MLLDVFQLVAYRDECIENLCALVYSRRIAVYHLTCCRDFETAYLHQIVNVAHLLDVCLAILANFVWSRLRTKRRELGLPLSEKTFRYIEHLGYFFY